MVNNIKIGQLLPVSLVVSLRIICVPLRVAYIHFLHIL